MKKDVSAAPGDSRERVLLFLAFLTSDACLRACHRLLPPDALAFSLCRLWFDEIYVPSTRYLAGLKGARSDAAVRRFQACFTEAELEALERFHRFLELRIDMLPDTARHLAAFPENDSWRNLVKDAAYVLEALEADPDRLRSQLAWVVQQVVRRREDRLEAWR